MRARSLAIFRRLARFVAIVLLFLGTVAEAEHARFHAGALRFQAAVAAGETSNRPSLWPGESPCPLCEIEGTLTQSAHVPTIDLAPTLFPHALFGDPATPQSLRIGRKNLDCARGPPANIPG